MAKRACAYCGSEVGGRERDHVIPSSLYPATKSTSRVQRLTVPCCRACNAGWCDDEPQFRNLLAVAGDPNSVVSDLWDSTIWRGFHEKDGHRRVSDLWGQLFAVQTKAGERHAVNPVSDPRFTRILRKIVRGLHFYHHLWHPVPDSLVEADVLRYQVPQEFIEAMPVRHREPDVFRYRFEVFDQFGEIPMSSAWLLTFFDTRKFMACVWKPGHPGRSSA